MESFCPPDQVHEAVLAALEALSDPTPMFSLWFTEQALLGRMEYGAEYRTE